ncbi:unnamed protein product [Sphagnum balticum]
MPCLPRSVTDCLFSLWKTASNFRGKQKDEREDESDGRHEHLTMRCMQTSLFQCTTARFAETLGNHLELSNADAVSNCCLWLILAICR